MSHKYRIANILRSMLFPFLTDEAAMLIDATVKGVSR